MIEYKVIRAPEEAGKSILGRSKASYADALAAVLNEMGLDDWEFRRSEPGPDRHPLLIFSRAVKRLEDDLPGITLMDQHRPPKTRGDVRPRRAREVMEEDRETIERLRAGRRKIVVETSGASAETGPKNNVADILAAKIAKAQAETQKDN